MATLVGEQGLSLEMNCTEILYGWLVYQLRFLWHSESILNEKIFKRDDVFRRRGVPGAIHANLAPDNNWSRPILTGIIEDMLKGERRSEWGTVEPDINIAISRPTIHDDKFEVVVSADVNMFEGCEYYGSGGLSLTMTVTKESLVNFCVELGEEHDRLVCADCDGGDKGEGRAA